MRWRRRGGGGGGGGRGKGAARRGEKKRLPWTRRGHLLDSLRRACDTFIEREGIRRRINANGGIRTWALAAIRLLGAMSKGDGHEKRDAGKSAQRHDADEIENV